MPETINFDRDSPGGLPAGWLAGVTGKGSPKWAVEGDTTAPSAPNVLKQSGAGTFAWCIKKDALLRDGAVEVKSKPIAVGVWTKADSVTAFDDFSYTSR